MLPPSISPGCHWMLVKLPIRETTRLNSSLWNQAALKAQIPPEELPVMPRLWESFRRLLRGHVDPIVRFHIWVDFAVVDDPVGQRAFRYARLLVAVRKVGGNIGSASDGDAVHHVVKVVCCAGL